jgi:hypothetical protein
MCGTPMIHCDTSEMRCPLRRTNRQISSAAKVQKNDFPVNFAEMAVLWDVAQRHGFLMVA